MNVQLPLITNITETKTSFRLVTYIRVVIFSDCHKVLFGHSSISQLFQFFSNLMMLTLQFSCKKNTHAVTHTEGVVLERITANATKTHQKAGRVVTYRFTNLII